jgi:hypothetical protein
MIPRRIIAKQYQSANKAEKMHALMLTRIGKLAKMAWRMLMVCTRRFSYTISGTAMIEMREFAVVLVAGRETGVKSSAPCVRRCAKCPVCCMTVPERDATYFGPVMMSSLNATAGSWLEPGKRPSHNLDLDILPNSLAIV